MKSTTYIAVPLLVYIPLGHPFADRGEEYIEGSLVDHLRLIGLRTFVAEDYDNATVVHDDDSEHCLSADIHKVCHFVDGTTTPSLRTPPPTAEIDPYATLKAATQMLDDIGAEYEFPGYISITRFGLTFAFGKGLRDGKDVFCYHYGPAIDPSATQEGGLSTIAANVPDDELATWIRMEVMAHTPAEQATAHEIFHRPIGEPEEARKLFRYLHQHGMLFHPEDHPLDSLDGRILPADGLALKHRMNEASTFDNFDPCAFCLELEPSSASPEDLHLPKPDTHSRFQDMESALLKIAELADMQVLNGNSDPDAMAANLEEISSTLDQIKSIARQATA